MILLLGTETFAASQTLNCKFVDPTNLDQILIQLDSDQGGSFIYQSKTGDTTNEANPNSLALRKVTSDIANTSAYSNNSSMAQMTFKVPTLALFKAGTNIAVTLSTEIKELKKKQDQALNCSSKL